MRDKKKDYQCELECCNTCLMRTEKGTCNGLNSPAIREIKGTKVCAFYKDKRAMSEKEVKEYEYYILPIHVEEAKEAQEGEPNEKVHE